MTDVILKWLLMLIVWRGWVTISAGIPLRLHTLSHTLETNKTNATNVADVRNSPRVVVDARGVGLMLIVSRGLGNKTSAGILRLLPIARPPSISPDPSQALLLMPPTRAPLVQPGGDPSPTSASYLYSDPLSIAH